MHSLLRRRSSLKDCDVAQLLRFHYVKPLPMNNLRAGSGSSSGSERAFTPNLTPRFKHAAFPQSRGLWCGGPVRTALRKLQLNCYADVLFIITGATVTVKSLCVPACFPFLFFSFLHLRPKSFATNPLDCLLVVVCRTVFYNLPQGSPFLSVS